MTNVWTNGIGVLNGKTTIAQSVWIKESSCLIEYYSEEDSIDYNKIDFNTFLGRILSNNIKTKIDLSHPDYNLVTITATRCFILSGQTAFPEYAFCRFDKKKIIKFWQGSEAERKIFSF